jgi:hydrogenase maturation protease
VTERLVLGIGNLHRGDDAVGRMAARLLRPRVDADVLVAERIGEATEVLAVLRNAKRGWLIDAAQTGSPLGTIQRIDCSAALDGVVPRSLVSSHGWGLAEAIGLARALDMLPSYCIVYAIETADFTAGAAPSLPVSDAAHRVAELILAELSSPPPPSIRHRLRRVPARDRR